MIAFKAPRQAATSLEISEASANSGHKVSRVRMPDSERNLKGMDEIRRQGTGKGFDVAGNTAWTSSTARRIVIVTTCIWRYERGGTVLLHFGLALHRFREGLLQSHFSAL
jgi:hypothetical protein